MKEGLSLYESMCLQMGSVDKDFRFMATNDLMTELQKDSIKLDDDSEKKVVQSVLKLVEDKNGEVQNLAVKWLVVVRSDTPYVDTLKCIFPQTPLISGLPCI